MFFATFLLATGTTLVRTRRVLALYLLLPWALAVCYSRLILRVHTPVDVAAGGFFGLALGLAAWAAASALICRFARQ
jgi:membrane-associated phospholipid phosphatase